MRINLSGVESFSFEPIPAGTYPAKITDGEMVEVRNQGRLPAGTPGVNWEFTIQGGEYDGRKVWMNTWIAESTMPGLKALLEASGRFTPEQLDGDLDFEIEDLIGSDVLVVVRQRLYQGEMRNDVRRVKSISGEEAPTATSLLP